MTVFVISSNLSIQVVLRDIYANFFINHQVVTIVFHFKCHIFKIPFIKKILLNLNECTFILYSYNKCTNVHLFYFIYCYVAVT